MTKKNSIDTDSFVDVFFLQDSNPLFVEFNLKSDLVIEALKKDILNF